MYTALSEYASSAAWGYLSEANPHRGHIRDISAFLEAAKEIGTVPSSTDTVAVSEYLLSSANGIALSWLTISLNESYLSVATRLMPTFFSAVTDERICVHPEITE